MENSKNTFKVIVTGFGPFGNVEGQKINTFENSLYNIIQFFKFNKK